MRRRIVELEVENQRLTDENDRLRGRDSAALTRHIANRMDKHGRVEAEALATFTKTVAAREEAIHSAQHSRHQAESQFLLSILRNEGKRPEGQRTRLDVHSASILRKKDAKKTLIKELDQLFLLSLGRRVQPSLFDGGVGLDGVSAAGIAPSAAEVCSPSRHALPLRSLTHVCFLLFLGLAVAADPLHRPVYEPDLQPRRQYRRRARSRGPRRLQSGPRSPRCASRCRHPARCRHSRCRHRHPRQERAAKLRSPGAPLHRRACLSHAGSQVRGLPSAPY